MSQLFETVASQFQSTSQYEKFIKECEKEFDIKVYRLSGFTVQYARKIYSDLNEKYRDKSLEVLPSGWYENERRLYVWFVLCFMHYKVLDSFKFVDSNEKYWRNLSEVFWHKEVYFLKYQLLNICKAKSRTVWRAKEDELLRKVFKQFKLGEWNEVAKEFYRESEGQFFKTPKQCRERWQNHLNQGIRKGEWSREEDLIIFEFIAKNQRKNWAQIVKDMHQTRTQHMIKNRYKSLTTKMKIDRGVTEQQAVHIILENLRGKPERSKNEMDMEIEKVESEQLPDAQEVKQRQEEERHLTLKTPKRELEPNQSKISLLKEPESNYGASYYWDHSINPFNRSLSNCAESRIFFGGSSRNFKAFPAMEMPIEQGRKNTIFDPSESIKSVNSVKNTDSVILKIMSQT